MLHSALHLWTRQPLMAVSAERSRPTASNGRTLMQHTHQWISFKCLGGLDLAKGCWGKRRPNLEKKLPSLTVQLLWDFRAGTEGAHLMFKVWTLREAHILMAEIRAALIKSHYTKQGECLSLRAERDRCSSKLGCSQPLHSGAPDCGTWINEWM